MDMMEKSSQVTPLVVVLGASGFIGSAVSAALAARPGRLRLVSRHPRPVPEGAFADVELRALDLTESGALAEAVAGADAVIHLVAYTEGGWRVSEGDSAAERVNLGLVEDLVGICRGGRGPAVIFASSALIDAVAESALTAYCRQKLTAEVALAKATAEGVLRGISLRLVSVYGEGPAAASPRVVEVMVRKALGGEPITMWHDGTVRRDLLHVDDATSAILAALDHPNRLAGAAWQVGTGRGTPLGKVFAEIAQLVADRTGEPAVSVVQVTPQDPYLTDSVDLDVDTAAFRATTGWEPQVTLRDGLRRTVDAMAGMTGGGPP